MKGILRFEWVNGSVGMWIFIPTLLPSRYDFSFKNIFVHFCNDEFSLSRQSKLGIPEVVIVLKIKGCKHHQFSKKLYINNILWFTLV